MPTQNLENISPSTSSATALPSSSEILPSASSISEAAAYVPSELIVPESFPNEISSVFYSRFNTLVSQGDEECFSVSWSVNAIKEIYGEAPNTDSDYAIRAAGGLLAYIRKTQKIELTYLQKINFYSCDEFMGIDSASRRNLEIAESMRSH